MDFVQHSCNQITFCFAIILPGLFKFWFSLGFCHFIIHCYFEELFFVISITKLLELEVILVIVSSLYGPVQESLQPIPITYSCKSPPDT